MKVWTKTVKRIVLDVLLLFLLMIAVAFYGCQKQPPSVPPPVPPPSPTAGASVAAGFDRWTATTSAVLTVRAGEVVSVNIRCLSIEIDEKVPPPNQLDKTYALDVSALPRGTLTCLVKAEHTAGQKTMASASVMLK